MTGQIPARVDWTKLDQPTFDRFVHPLIIRRHAFDEPTPQVTPIDGRGGDGGVDIEVSNGETLLHVYQLKFFVHGFSGGLAKARKPQIRKSFEKAMKLNPPRWTLVLPEDVTPGEKAFVQDLGKSHPVKIEILAASQLDEMMAANPDLLHWATREPLVDTLRSLNLDGATLNEPGSFSAKLDELQVIADSRDPNWTSVIESGPNGERREVLKAKHPLAQSLDPMGLVSATLAIGEEEEMLLARTRGVIGFGDKHSVKLTSRHLKQVDFRMPSWLSAPEVSNDAVLRIKGPKSLMKNVKLEVRILNPDDTVAASYAGRTTHVGAGNEGAIIRGRMTGGIKIAIRLQHERDPRGIEDASIDISFSLGNHSAIETQAGLNLSRDLMSDKRVLFFLDGEQRSSVKPGSRRIPKGNMQELFASDVPALVDDLAFLEQRLNITTTIPRSLSAEDRIGIRAVRLLLEGKVILNPFMQSLDGTFSGVPDGSQGRFLTQGTGSFFVDSPLSGTILGQKVSLGMSRFVITNAQIVNHSQVLQAIAAGSLDQIETKVRPLGNEGVKVFLLDRERNEQELPVTPWSVQGIPEHPELRGISNPPDLIS